MAQGRQEQPFSYTTLAKRAICGAATDPNSPALIAHRFLPAAVGVAQGLFSDPPGLPVQSRAVPAPSGTVLEQLVDDVGGPGTCASVYAAINTAADAGAALQPNDRVTDLSLEQVVDAALQQQGSPLRCLLAALGVRCCSWEDLPGYQSR